MKLSLINTFRTQNIIPLQYFIAKIAVAILFVAVMIGAGFTAWLLMVKGVTVARLLQLAAILLAAYVGGAAHGEVDRRIKEAQEVANAS